jgi:hypothetical protein
MRIPVRSSSALCALISALLLLPAAASATSSQAEIDTAVSSAADWLRAQQGTSPFEPAEPYSGQIPGFGGDWSATALAAAGVDSTDVVDPALGPQSLQDHLLGEYSGGYWIEPPSFDPVFGTPVTEYERAILVSHAAGLDPARLSAASNLPAQIAGLWNTGTGSFGNSSSNATAFGILALRQTPLPEWALEPAVSYLRRNQHDDGGWTYGTALTPADREEPGDPDMTGAAIAALCEAGVPAYDPDVAEGVAYLNGRLEEGGAIEAPFGNNVDTNAWALSGLTACGIDAQGPEWASEAGRTPVDYILSLQVTAPGPEAGGFGYSAPEFPGVYTTQDALRAIAGEVFTAAPPSLRPLPGVAAGTPVPHALAIQLAPGNVRMCEVTAAAGAPLRAVLDAAKTSSYPPGCVKSLSVADGRVVSIDGLEAASADEAWLARLDRGETTIAAQQAVGFGDLISLRRGAVPAGSQVATGPAGPPGPAGAPGKRGRRGKPGRNATIACKVKKRPRGKKKVHCSVRQGKGDRAKQR